MTQLEKTLLESIEVNFGSIINVVEIYEDKLDKSISHFESDQYVEHLIQSQKLLKKLSEKIDISINDIIEKHY